MDSAVRRRGAGKGWSGTLVLLSAAVFAVSVGYGVVLPLLPFMLGRLLVPASPGSVGRHTAALAAGYLLALSASAPLAGRLADRIGRRPLILWGLGGSSVATALVGLASSLPLLYIARLLAGVSAASVITAALATAADTGRHEVRASRFARIAAATTLGFLAGPALAGWLSDMRTPPPLPGLLMGRTLVWPFLVAATLGVAVLVAVIAWLPAKAPSDAREKSHRLHAATADPFLSIPAPGELRDALAGPLTLTFVVMFALGGFEVGLTLLAQQSLRLGPGLVGILFMECSVAMLAEQALMPGSLIAREGMRRLVTPALIMAAVSLVALPVVGYREVFWLVVLVALGLGVLVPLSAYWVSLADKVATQGAAFGGQTAFANLGQAAGAAASGLLFAVRPAMPFWLAAGLLLVTAALRPRVALEAGASGDKAGT